MFVIMGVGGDPSMPDELYIVPLKCFQEAQTSIFKLRQFKRDVVDRWFSIEEFIRNKCTRS